MEELLRVISAPAGYLLWILAFYVLLQGSKLIEEINDSRKIRKQRQQEIDLMEKRMELDEKIFTLDEKRFLRDGISK